MYYKRISGWKFLLLGYFTFGIYPLYVWYKMTQNMNDMAHQVNEKPILGFVPAFILGVCTLTIYTWVWFFKFFGLAARLNRKANAGIAPSNAFAMFLVSLIPYFSFFWMANMNNKLADAYERK